MTVASHSPYDFAAMKELKGEKYTLEYPSGYEKEALELKIELDKIIPFVDSYTAANFNNVLVRLVEHEYQIGNNAGESASHLEALNVTLGYNLHTYVHEICHLGEKPFFTYSKPLWISEGHADTCAVKYWESQGNFDEVKRVEENNKVLLNLPYNINLSDSTNFVFSLHLQEPNVTHKAYALSYSLMKEVQQHLTMADFFTKAREDFWSPHELVRMGVPIPENNWICKMNEVASTDLLPIFRKYGFPIEECNKEMLDSVFKHFENLECWNVGVQIHCREKFQEIAIKQEIVIKQEPVKLSTEVAIVTSAMSFVFFLAIGYFIIKRLRRK